MERTTYVLVPQEAWDKLSRGEVEMPQLQKGVAEEGDRAWGTRDPHTAPAQDIQCAGEGAPASNGESKVSEPVRLYGQKGVRACPQTARSAMRFCFIIRALAPE